MYLQIIVFIILLIFVIFYHYWNKKTDNFSVSKIQNIISTNPNSNSNSNSISQSSSSIIITSSKGPTDSKPYIYIKSNGKVNINGKEKTYEHSYDSSKNNNT